jgi:peptidoglycan/LPS O-acetylase OafA/YrhL
LQLLSVITLPPNNLLFVLTYTVNFARMGTWVTGHLWSFSVEEQFYLLWPLVFKFVRLRTSIVIAVVTIFGGIIVRAVDSLSGIQLVDPALRYAFPFVAGPIAMGCLLAIAAPRIVSRMAGIRRVGGFGLSAVILFAFWLDTLDLGTANRFIGLFANLLLTFLVARFVFSPNDGAGRFLNSAPMIALGK